MILSSHRSNVQSLGHRKTVGLGCSCFHLLLYSIRSDFASARSAASLPFSVLRYRRTDSLLLSLLALAACLRRSLFRSSYRVNLSLLLFSEHRTQSRACRGRSSRLAGQSSQILKRSGSTPLLTCCCRFIRSALHARQYFFARGGRSR